MRKYIPGNISIDGRNIEYEIVTAGDYLMEKYNYSEEQIEEFIESNYDVYTKINQTLALKQSCYLLRRVSHSCGSLAVDLYDLKEDVIKELHNEHNFQFDDEFVENYGKVDQDDNNKR